MVIATSGKSNVRANRIKGNGYEAIWIYEGGGGVVEHNDLRGNAMGAWDLAADCKDNVFRAHNKE
ncbi:parallel beta-helix repeat protein [Streptomyces calvus]